MAQGNTNQIQFEVVEHGGVRFAEVIWADSRASITKFCSPPSSSMQFGLLAHEKGFVEPAHYHKPMGANSTGIGGSDLALIGIAGRLGQGEILMGSGA